MRSFSVIKVNFVKGKTMLRYVSQGVLNSCLLNFYTYKSPPSGIVTILNTAINRCQITKSEWVMSHISLNCEMPKDQPNVTFSYKASIKGTLFSSHLCVFKVTAWFSVFVRSLYFVRIVFRNDCNSFIKSDRNC